MTGAASTIGSGGSSEWGREYEDEDTWYELSSAYQSGADTYLLPSQVSPWQTADLKEYFRIS